MVRPVTVAARLLSARSAMAQFGRREGSDAVLPSSIRITLAAALVSAIMLIGLFRAPPVPVALGAVAACGAIWWRSRHA
jgi:hypothetical protein